MCGALSGVGNGALASEYSMARAMKGFPPSAPIADAAREARGPAHIVFQQIQTK